jgi:hypothetical protein
MSGEFHNKYRPRESLITLLPLPTGIFEKSGIGHRRSSDVHADGRYFYMRFYHAKSTIIA